MKSFGSLIVTPFRTKAGDVGVGGRVHDRRSGDCDQIESAIRRLQEHRRGRAADLDRIGEDRGRNIRIDADQYHLGVEAVPFKDTSSTATIAEAQSLVAVQPIWILPCA